MKRDFQFITKGKIFEELLNEGLTDFGYSQLYRFEKRGVLPASRRTGGKWRIYSREEANRVKEIIWNWYGGKKNFYLEEIK